MSAARSLKPLAGTTLGLLAGWAAAALLPHAWASQYVPITFKELDQRSKYVVAGEVESVKENDRTTDLVTLRVGSFLKGESDRRRVTFLTCVRGGLKDFDPLLKPGDHAIVFLNDVSKEPALRAYTAAIAVFPKSPLRSPEP